MHANNLDVYTQIHAILTVVSLCFRLKEIICALQAERQQQRSREEEGDRLGVVGQEPRGPEELRWRVNQLERDKLELTSKHNEQVSSLEGQVARLRAAVERGEAQRQTLEYDMAVVRKEAGVERSNLQENMAALCSQNEQLMELQQRVCVLQKALEITRMAREEDQHALQQEVEERDGLVLSANTENDQLTAENKHLHTLLQDQEQTLQELNRRMGEVQRERERDGEALRRQTSELGYITEREERMKKELETALQRVKTLETNIESERAAHLESKFNSEIIQLRIRDLEAALQVEKCSQAEAVSSLDMVKQQFREVERAYSIERDRARDSTGRLAQLEKDYLSSKAELSAELEKERKTASQVRDQLQELHTLHTHSLTQLDMARKRQVLLEEEYESYLRELQQLLQLHTAVGPLTAVGQLTTEEPVGEGRKHSPSTVMNMLGTTLTTYQTTLDQTTTEVTLLTLTTYQTTLDQTTTEVTLLTLTTYQTTLDQTTTEVTLLTLTTYQTTLDQTTTEVTLLTLTTYQTTLDQTTTEVTLLTLTTYQTTLDQTTTEVTLLTLTTYQTTLDQTTTEVTLLTLTTYQTTLDQTTTEVTLLTLTTYQTTLDQTTTEVTLLTLTTYQTTLDQTTTEVTLTTYQTTLDQTTTEVTLLTLTTYQTTLDQTTTEVTLLTLTTYQTTLDQTTTEVTLLTLTTYQTTLDQTTTEVTLLTLTTYQTTLDHQQVLDLLCHGCYGFLLDQQKQSERLVQEVQCCYVINRSWISRNSQRGWSRRFSPTSD
uniref:Uncharacterized protein n=1 Tax=Oncorhynchus kisutch TaxID=8019 RepID=A0A8C7FPZ8_ONCKI